MNLMEEWLVERPSFEQKNNIIQSVLGVGSHIKYCSALQSNLLHPSIVDQTADCGYYWKESENIKCALSNMEHQTYMLDRTVKGKKKKTEKAVIFFSISKDKESKLRSIDMLTNHLVIPRRTRYSLFKRDISLCDGLLYTKENLKRSSVN